MKPLNDITGRNLKIQNRRKANRVNEIGSVEQNSFNAALFLW